MKEDLLMIPTRVKELREILDISVPEMAGKLGVSEAQYIDYETAAADIPISTLYDIAAELGTDFTVLLTGEQPRMASQSVSRAGEGISVERYKGYSYSSLAYNFIGRDMEPMIVTLSPAETAGPVFHAGQEFNLRLSGTVKVTVGKRENILNEGDSIYFDSSIPHAQAAIGGEAKFLTVILEK